MKPRRLDGICPRCKKRPRAKQKSGYAYCSPCEKEKFNARREADPEKRSYVQRRYKLKKKVESILEDAPIESVNQMFERTWRDVVRGEELLIRSELRRLKTHRLNVEIVRERTNYTLEGERLYAHVRLRLLPLLPRGERPLP